MKKLALAALVALAIAGCAKSPSLDLSTSVTLNTIEGVQGAYGIALSTERTYKDLCRNGTLTYATCAPIVSRLQAADLKAVSAIGRAVRFVKTYPTIDASNVISAARTAVSDLQAIVSTTGVK
jgi:heterodisulfide reductase subunit A-like polyferredoxin